MSNSCGSCSECCHLLEVDEIHKPWNTWCNHAEPGRGCKIYENRPPSCVMFKCLWLKSQERLNPKEHLPLNLRPNRTHVVFYRNGEERDPRTIFVHVDPAYPNAWKLEPVAGELLRLAMNGAVVIIVVGKNRIVFEKTTINHTDEDTIKQNAIV